MQTGITRVELNQLKLEAEVFPEKIWGLIGKAYEANNGKFPRELIPTITTVFGNKPFLLNSSKQIGEPTLLKILIETAPESEAIYKLAIDKGVIVYNPPDDLIRLWGLGFKFDAAKIEKSACKALYQRDCLWLDNADAASVSSDAYRLQIVEAMGAVGGQKSLECLEVVAFQLAPRIPEIRLTLEADLGIQLPKDSKNMSGLDLHNAGFMAALSKAYPFEIAEDKLIEAKRNPEAIDQDTWKKQGEASGNTLPLGIEIQVLNAVWTAIKSIKNRLGAKSAA